MKTGSPAFYRCEICHFSYRFQRLWWAGLLGHPATAGALFTLLLLAATGFLGFVPVVEGLLSLREPVTRGSAVGLVLHFADGFILVGLAGFVFMAAAACSRGRCGGPTLCDGCYFGPHCAVGDCGACGDCVACAGAGGEACGAVMLVVMVPLAVVGLLFVVGTMYRALFAALRESLKWAERLVENVGPEPRTAVLRGGDGGGAGGGGGGGSWRRGGGGGGAGMGGVGGGASGSGTSGTTAITPPEKECMV
ncbi:hypothetical protein GPECTOR_8g288 [Gonium pectorale]|uniref:Uncharacterized protein n=1 Tax=Gonium pectorale TaxID=33097 RepID=A0A150GSQ8_GONPE|nr:hypothetical protein GPECTOR_8g288 [Gonium pectorale]|eukprot:KXZ52909.1 hypothetical protein GPECTOR_8g288 [Gonium pectorale]